MAANSHKSPLVHRYSDAFDFNDNQDALAAALNVNTALAYLTGGIVARSMHLDATRTEKECLEGIADGITALFDYQKELLLMAAGQSALPFVSKDASCVGGRDLMRALGVGDDD